MLKLKLANEKITLTQILLSINCGKKTKNNTKDYRTDNTCNKEIN